MVQPLKKCLFFVFFPYMDNGHIFLEKHNILQKYWLELNNINKANKEMSLVVNFDVFISIYAFPYHTHFTNSQSMNK